MKETVICKFLVQHGNKFYLELWCNIGTENKEKIIIPISKKNAELILKYIGIQKYQK